MPLLQMNLGLGFFLMLLAMHPYAGSWTTVLKCCSAAATSCTGEQHRLLLSCRRNHHEVAVLALTHVLRSQRERHLLCPGRHGPQSSPLVLQGEQDQPAKPLGTLNERNLSCA